LLEPLWTVLHEFILDHHDLIVERARARLRARRSPRPTDVELQNGVPVFLRQLADALRVERPGRSGDHANIVSSAGRHGTDLLGGGLTIAQVVHDYGDICQVITELAIERDALIGAEEFRTLNLCLDDAIASAVTTFAQGREQAIAATGTARLGHLAHELRNHLNNARLSFEMLKRGQVALHGSTGAVFERSLRGLGILIDRSLAEVRLDAGVEHREVISAGELVEEVEIGAVIQAKARNMEFSVVTRDPKALIEGDRQILGGALANLLQNAFKFTRPRGAVILRTLATAERVHFEVEDECGGLPPGHAEDLFRPWEQRGADRTGVGLGLAICVKAARATGGDILVRDKPGEGCIFTLDLPRTVQGDLSGRERERRRGAAPGDAVERESSAELLRDCSADDEAESGAAVTGRPAAEERVEDMR
jgi:signal transduction histidine kinase